MLLIIFLLINSILSDVDKSRVEYFAQKLKEPKNYIEDDYLRERVLTTLSCSDLDHIPKVKKAGEVIEEPNSRKYQLMFNGIKILEDCYYGDWIKKLIRLMNGHHEPQEEKVFNEVLKFIPDNAVMIELGSYWAYYSLWFNSVVKGAHNYCIEPDPKNILIGMNNFRLNNRRADFTQAALGSNSEQNIEFIDWDYNKHLVNQVSIDDFCKQKKLDRINILHSDIQGFEVEMLKGSKKMLEDDKIDYLFISTHRGVHEKIIEILSSYNNLEIILEHSRLESFSGDGLVVAKSKRVNGPKKIEVSKRDNNDINLIKSFITL